MAPTLSEGTPSMDHLSSVFQMGAVPPLAGEMSRIAGLQGPENGAESGLSAAVLGKDQVVALKLNVPRSAVVQEPADVLDRDHCCPN